ncbi:MAG: sensor histidine kinase [Bryobacteraceae bacterium]
MRARRQVLLFLAAVAAPCLVVAALIVRLMGQERELAGKRQDDERRVALERLRDGVLARLERLKLEALAGTQDPAVVFAGWVREGRLVLPGESANHRGSTNAEFEARVRAGERAEFAEGKIDAALAAYSAAARAARTPAEAWRARLLRARALEKSGRPAGFRPLLAAPQDLADDDGVPLRLHAAERLAGSPEERARVLATAGDVMRRPWLPPAACYMLSTIAEKTGALRDEVAARIRVAEQASALQADFARLNVRPAAEPLWVLYGAQPWLVGGAPPDRVVAIRAGPVFEGFAARGARFLAAHEPGGELLGRAFPNLKAEVAAVSAGVSVRWNVYYGALLLVALVALYGAALLWRDMRREVRMADMQAQFVASVSHELKTPLTAIRMFAETLQMGRSRDPETAAEYLGTIVNECERLTRLVDGVLQFAKLEQGKKIFHPRRTDLGRAVYAAVRAMQYPLEQKGFELRVEIEDGLPPVNADPDAIEQATLNLLSNAMKYSGGNREIGLRVRRSDGDALVQVWDRGIGIAPAEQARIFEKFYRVPGEDASGAGLGLTLVAQIAHAHGGEVTVESAPGKGSTFTLRLPLQGGEAK